MPITSTGELPQGLYYVNVYSGVPDGVKWVNRYLIEKVGSDQVASGLVLSRFLNAHAYVLTNWYRVLKITLSTYEPDSDVYDANEFVTEEFNVQGQIDVWPYVPLPPQYAVRVTKDVVTGKNGKVFLRGFALQTWVSFTAQGIVLNLNNSNLLNAFDQYKAELTPFTSADAPLGVRLVMLGNPIRRVTELRMVGLSYRKLNNRYFDRNNETQ